VSDHVDPRELEWPRLDVPDPLRIDDVDRLDRGRGRRQGEEPDAVSIRARLRHGDLRRAVAVRIRCRERLAPHRRETPGELYRFRVDDAVSVQIRTEVSLALACLRTAAGHLAHHERRSSGARDGQGHRHHSTRRESETEIG
jgi:hypothetical protein